MEVARQGRAADMAVRPLGPVMGAEITGLDLSQPLSRGAFEQLEEPFLECKLPCVRDQALDIDQQIAFTELWGRPLEHTMANHARGGPRNLVRIASHVGPDGKANGKQRRREPR